MTPAQRAAKIAAAEALLNDVAADETAPAVVAPVAQTIAQAQAQVAASVLPVAKTVVNGLGIVQSPVPAPSAITGPGGDTRVSGQPSLLQTMKTVWANMKAKK